MPGEPTDSLERYPQLVAFDLDYTLWDLWIDTHVTGPLRRKGDALNEVVDKYNQPISFYKDVPGILHGIRARSNLKLEDGPDTTVIIAACSRTHAPNLANQCLRLLLVPPSAEHGVHEAQPAIEFFDELEIYPGSKLKHFKELHEKTDIPYTDMLFFDDESRNSEVEKLGVTFQIVPNGLSRQAYEAGLRKWRKLRLKDTPEAD
ncbi:magnesium-dependent phosphatase-1 [Panaeolus papilionaceus]|nr:magnesium-dependent phosphatase-1 [Panaeolus papilionaceus]